MQEIQSYVSQSSHNLYVQHLLTKAIYLGRKIITTVQQ